MKIVECVVLGIMRKVINGIFEKNEVIQVLKLFKAFVKYIPTTFLFHIFLLLFSCCLSELESLRIFKIPLSGFELCKKKMFLGFSFYMYFYSVDFRENAQNYSSAFPLS